MLYAFVRAVVGLAVRCFYRLRVNAPHPIPSGPVMFVGNHPNALVDPALVFVITPRHVTFLAKAPLFRMPVIGWLLKGMGGLPVYRKQDDPSQMGKNTGTLEAASAALTRGGAITLFPEGRSHSEPALGEMKTGAARIALSAGVKVSIVPVGLTYAEKHRFRSEVRIEIGEPLVVEPPPTDGASPEVVRALTARIGEALRRVTLNLAAWGDLPILQTGEAFLALARGDRAGDPERLRRFAKGLEILRAEQPDRVERVRQEVVALRRHLELLRVRPEDLPVRYHPLVVIRFGVRNLFALAVGLPLFICGVVCFGLPALFVRWAASRAKEADLVATVKLLGGIVFFPLWSCGLAGLAWYLAGPWWALAVLLGALPLALFSRYFYEHRSAALHDARIFFLLGNRKRLKARLLGMGEALAKELEQLADELGPRLEAS